MSNPYAEHKQAEAIERIAAALERIADAAQSYAAADPLTVLHEAMQGAGADGDPPVDPMAGKEPVDWFASNGNIVMYKHPDSRFEVVLRQDPSAESGYVVAIEEV